MKEYVDVLTIRGLKKSFGTHEILKELDLSVPKGSIYGFIGQNGAGKTTTMKLILGLLKPDAGEILVCGSMVQFGQTRTNSYIGCLPDVPEFYHYMNPQQYLGLCGEIIGLPKKEIVSRSSELLSLVGLTKADKRIGGFSRGMKQRLGIAQALLNRPKLLLCDEPTSALDPVGRKEILDILCRIRDFTTVLFSTHILTDVERICSHAAILNEGRTAVSGTLAKLKALSGNDKLLLEFSSEAELKQFMDQDKMRPLLAGAERRGRSIVLYGENRNKLQEIVIFVLSDAGLCPIKMECMEPSLESLFLEAIG